MGEETSWSRLFEHRDRIHERYPEIWDLKILRKRFPLLLETVRDGERVLDIGASNRNLEGRLKRHLPGLVYRESAGQHVPATPSELWLGVQRQQQHKRQPISGWDKLRHHHANSHAGG